MFSKIESWLMAKGEIDKFSFKVCLLVGLVALVLSVFGYSKGKKIATISPSVYVILQIFMKVWFGV